VLINSLLELAQINREKEIAFSNVRIDEIVFNAIHQVMTKYQGRKIVPKIRYPENSNELLINGNFGMLEIAIKNLLDNACKFSNEDVGVEFIISDKLINIIISDKGIGIPTKEVESVYEPFKRASNVKYIGGFGIGLSLVAKILELHKATLKVDSRENEGTRIEILFRPKAGS
jgi:signal transduction histidine kinase